MTVGSAAAVFVLGAGVSLATSWLLVSRLERVGERLAFSEANLGIVAALAADTPEITASVAAMAHHQQTMGPASSWARTCSTLPRSSAWAPSSLAGSTCTEKSSSWAGRSPCSWESPAS